MQLWGHLGASLLTYAPIGGGLLAAGDDRLAVAGGLVAAATATLPDLDLAVSGVDHRGPTHTLWFALGVGTVSGAGGALLGSIVDRLDSRRAAAIAGLAGFGSTATHVAVDSLTPMGIRPFAPLHGQYYGFDVVPSRNRRGNRALLGAGVVATVLAAAAGRALASRSTPVGSDRSTAVDGGRRARADDTPRTGQAERR